MVNLKKKTVRNYSNLGRFSKAAHYLKKTPLTTDHSEATLRNILK